MWKVLDHLERMVGAGHDEHVIDVETNEAELVPSCVREDENGVVDRTHLKPSSNEDCSDMEAEPPSTLLQPIHCLLQLPDPVLLSFDFEARWLSSIDLRVEIGL